MICSALAAPPPPSCGCPAGIRRRAWQQQHLPTRRETPVDCRAPRGAVANVGLSCVRETSRPCARLVCATESVPRHFERRGLQRRAEGNMTILTSQSLFTGENVYYVAGWRLGWSARLNGILALIRLPEGWRRGFLGVCQRLTPA